MPLEERTSSILNLSTPEVIGFYLAQRANAGIISDLSAWLWSSCERWNGPTAADKKKKKKRGDGWGRERGESEIQLAAFFSSQHTGAWQRRSGPSLSGEHLDELLFIASWCTLFEYVAFTRLCFFLRDLKTPDWFLPFVGSKKKKNSDMRYLALLRPEPVKSQPTASEFNWRAQMFADVHGLLKCPCFFIFPESYSSAAGSLSACAEGEGTKLKKKKASTTVRFFNLTVSSVPARKISWLQKIPMISFQFLIAAIISGHLKELCRAYFRSSLQLHPIGDQKSSLNWPI